MAEYYEGVKVRKIAPHPKKHINQYVSGSKTRNNTAPWAVARHVVSLKGIVKTGGVETVIPRSNSSKKPYTWNREL
jgi:hypothetical protein